MAHLPFLISDLALILIAAGITTLIFRRLKQPVVLGYILAGLLVGPNTSLFPSITDLEGVKIWAEIGVIFLLFALGLEFSFRKLKELGATAGTTGIIEITSMAAIGYITAQMLGWPLMDSLFLGGIIAISSTTIIFRAFEELGIKTKQFTSLVLGVLIVEDLMAVLMMVLLSTLAATQQVEGGEMLLAIGKLLFFLCLWFLLGIFILPTLLKRASKWLSSETLLIGALGLCLGMVVLATSVGFSAALGAFIMGSILSETVYGEKIEHLIVPVKNLFGAIFFVSVGMLIDLSLLWEYIIPVLILTAVVIIGKLLFVSIGALIAGRPLSQAIEAGSSMTQIGEFSFIIATLGISLNVTSSYLYPIAVGVSVITTFTTPYVIKFAAPLNKFLEKSLPQKWQKGLRNYSAGSQVLRAESDWRTLFGAYLQLIIINGVIIISLLLLSRYYLKPFMLVMFEQEIYGYTTAIVISLGAMLPFIWALVAKKIHRRAYRTLWLNSKYNHGPLVTIEVLRILIAVGFVGLLFAQYMPIVYAFGGAAIVMVIVFFLFKQRLDHFYHRIEDRFLMNLNEKQQSKKSETLAPWDAHLSVVHINPSSPLVGLTLQEAQLRENMGINIAYIARGNKLIYAPLGTERLFPHDELGAIGTDNEMIAFTPFAEGSKEEATPIDEAANRIVLQKLLVDEHNQLTGKKIRESKIRELALGLVVGIERNEERMLNPPSDTIFEWHDIVWIVGDKDKIDVHFIHTGKLEQTLMKEK